MNELDKLIITVLSTESASEAVQLQKLAIIKSLLETRNNTTSRIPAPSNITEIGGYINLLAKQREMEEQQHAMLLQMLAKILGLQAS